jgi:parvulin-like peptidyl-prolyl isomerase
MPITVRTCDARRLLGATKALSLGLAGCLSAGNSPVVRDAARPAADARRADAPALCPTIPVTTTSATRGQSGDVQPASGTIAPNGRVAARLRANVNGIPILDDEVREAIAQHIVEWLNVPEAQRAAVQQKIAERELQQLIDRELVLEEAFAKLKSLNKPDVIRQLQETASKEADKRLRDIKGRMFIKNDEELKAVLQTQGLTVAGLRRQSERDFMKMEYIRNLIFPVVQRIGLHQVRQYYQEHPEEFLVEDRVKWQDIFIDVGQYPNAAAARGVAEQVVARARAGEDFAALAKQYDNGDSRLRNGEGLGQKRGEIVPPQAEVAVWSQKPGEVGLIDMGFGLHIVRVAERQYAGLRPFDEACQADVRIKLQGKIADQEYKRIVNDLKRRASITIFP